MTTHSTKFKDVLEFMLTIKVETEFHGTTAKFQRDYQVRLEMLRRGLAQDHELKQLKQETPLGPQAAEAFEAFKLWYASNRYSADP